MKESHGPERARRLTEAVRRACIEAALDGYEQASLAGLCREGAWEAALCAIRRLDLASLSNSPSPADGSAAADASPEETLSDLAAGLALHFATPGPPGAGSAAAVTGASAAGLLEWGAVLSEQRGPTEFSRRAAAIARRASVLRRSLAVLAQEDETRVRGLLRARGPGANSEARARATDSALEIGARCAQVVTLAVEVANRGCRTVRPDVVAALELAWSATHCVLDLVEVNLHRETHDAGIRSARRRAWRLKLMLNRAEPHLPRQAPRIQGLPGP